METDLLLLFCESACTFLGFFDPENATGIVIEIQDLGFLPYTLVFLIDFVEYTVQLKVFFGIHTYGAENTVVNILEFIESNLFVDGFVSLIELSKKFP